MTSPFLSTILSVLRKDLVAEFRSRELVSAMVLFALLSVLVFSFALQLDRSTRQEAISGVLWVTVTYAVVLGFNRNSTVEREGGSFQAMLLAPVSRGAIYIGKMLGNFLFASVIGLALLPLMTVLYNVNLVQFGAVVVLIFGVFGIAVVGTLLATMTVQTRTRETLLPIVMLPVALPLLLLAVSATNNIVDGNAFEEWSGLLVLIAIIDLLYAALCYLLFEYVIED
ncbi:MAG: heme exporter protein CcmB [Chloroflexota bacterium]